MTKAMPFLQKVILLSYDPRPFGRGAFAIVEIHLRMYRIISPGGAGFRRPLSSERLFFIHCQKVPV